MKKFVLNACLLLLGNIVVAQSCEECRYISQVFDSIEVQTIQFGSGVNAAGNQQDLFFDLYTPFGDTASNRPIMIFAFGGGFIQGSRDEDYVKDICRRFAQAGYVSAGIDYRIGFDPLGALFTPNQELMRTFFRAMQDMRGAIQWFRAHEDVMGNTLRIDPDKIISGGASAGGIAACMVAYCDKDTEFGEIGSLSAISGLGSFTSSSGLYPTYSYESAGVFNIAGALVNTDWIEAGDPPIFSAHGDADLVVPYQGGNFGLGPISIGLEGSYNIDQAAHAIGVCSYLYTMEGEGHPSGNESEAYRNAMYVRAFPRSKALVEGQNFCCNHTVDIVNIDSNAVSGPLTLLANSSAVSGPALQWCSFDCLEMGNSDSLDISPTGEPRYFTISSTSNNCTSTDFFVSPGVVVSARPPVSPETLHIFPVPATTSINVLTKPGALKSQTIYLIDLNGRQLMEWKANAQPQQTLELPPLAKGLYILQVGDAGQYQIAIR